MINESDRRMGQFRKDADPVKAGLARAYHELAQTWIKAYRDFPFPLEPNVTKTSRAARKAPRIAAPSSSEVLPLRLKPIPFEIEIPTVSAEVYAETRKAVEATGAFIAPIRSVTMEDLLAEDIQREARGWSRRFNHSWVNSSQIMRATVPPEMEVFINPKALRIEGSNSLSTDEQKKRIAQAAASFREQLPEGVRPLVDMHMVDPSTMAQLEEAWMDAGNGFLLPNYFARTDVQTVRGRVANVGRLGLHDQREVHGWRRDNGLDNVFAVPVGVLPRKLAA